MRSAWWLVRRYRSWRPISRTCAWFTDLQTANRLLQRAGCRVTCSPRPGKATPPQHLGKNHYSHSLFSFTSLLWESMPRHATQPPAKLLLVSQNRKSRHIPLPPYSWGVKMHAVKNGAKSPPIVDMGNNKKKLTIEKRKFAKIYYIANNLKKDCVV